MITNGIDVVIVDFNSAARVREAVQSLLVFPAKGASLERIIVVDNASTEPAKKILGDLIEPRVDIVRNATNRGFGAACNQGARNGDAEYILFLNPDANVCAGTLDCVVNHMKLRPDVGIAGVKLLNSEDRITVSCSQFPRASHYVFSATGLNKLLPSKFPVSFMQQFDHATTRNVDQVMGAFFFVRRTVFDVLGGFDERFFVYFEEVDFSLRAAMAGWNSLFIADTGARHHGHGTTDTIRATRLFLSLQSRLRYAHKHFSLTSFIVTLFATTLVEPLSRLTLALLGRTDTPVDVVIGFRRLYHWLVCEGGPWKRSQR